MRPSILAVGGLALATGLALAGTFAHGADAPQDEAVPAPVPAGVKATVEDLVFVSGHWELEKGEDLLEEHWSEPLGDSLVGSFRWVKKGETVWMYELLTMRNEDDGVTMRFRHFSDELVGWEEKDEPLRLRLVSLEGERAVFQHFGGDDDPWTMVFDRIDVDALTITIRKRGEETGGQVFAYRTPDDD